MPRYVDADALKPDYIVGSTSTNTECYRYVSLKQIVNAPTADVVEVVRCKHCAHYDFSEVNITPYSVWYRCKATGMYTPQIHYCGFGDRRG